MYVQRKGQGFFKGMVVLAKYRIAGFFEKGCDIVFLQKNGVPFMGECYFFGRHISESAALYTLYSATMLIPLFRQMTAVFKSSIIF
jgi:hypothetical protein